MAKTVRGAFTGIRNGIALFEKRRRWFKIRLYATVVLPVFAVILALKAVRTYAHLRMRQITARTPKPVKMEPVKAGTVRPEPAGEPAGQEQAGEKIG